MYEVTFTDGTIFKGGQPSNSLWDQMPDKPIRSILYSLTPFLEYKFSGFDSYNHTVERVRGVNTTLEIINKVIIMGRTQNRVYEIMMDAKGGVYQLVVENGKEYSPVSKLEDGKFKGWVNGKPLSGWRHGVQLAPGESPRLELITVKE
jgi:hypothetical protein